MRKNRRKENALNQIIEVYDIVNGEFFELPIEIWLKGFEDLQEKHCT